MNGLEALNRLYGFCIGTNKYYKQFLSSREPMEKDKDVIEKELKAFEIIKRKSTLDFDDIRNADNYDEYLKHFGKVIQETLRNGESIHFAVIKDEFDLLKEVMK